MKFVIYHNPIGGLDTDTHDTLMSSEDYRDAVNLRNVSTYIGKQSVLSNIKGNVLVSYSLGGIKHKCIGSYEDKKGRTIIYFLWAKDGNHKILRYNVEKVSVSAPYGVIEEVMKYNFGWKERTKITSVDLVDGKLLYWVDPKPRKINIEKAILTEKIKTWKIFFPKNFNTAVTVGNISVTITNRGTGGVVATDSTFSILITDTASQILSNFATYLNATFGSYLTAEYCTDCCVDLTEDSVLNYNISITGSAPFIVVPENWYGNNTTGGGVNDRTFERIKYPPIYQPTSVHKADANKLFNKVKRKVFQFRTQFHYDDNESSKLSPISQISINNTQSEALMDSLNYIEVNVNNSVFDEVTLVTLKRISILFRERNTGVWRTLGQMDICDLLDYNVSTKLLYKFYNDTNSSGISDVLASSQYDKVPIEANASNFVENRIVDGGVTDNYDTDRCIELTPQVNVLDVVQDEYVTLTGKIKIMSYLMNDSPYRSGTVGVDDYPFYLPSSIEPQTGKIRGLITHDTTDNNPYPVFGGAMYGYGGGWDFDITLGIKDTWKQTLPEAGWAVYSAGTDMMTVSKQIDFGTDLFQHASGAIDASSVGQIIKIGKHFQAYQEAYSTFTLVVPKNSKHIIRLASHLCSFGDKLGLGDSYDLNKSLYQKTSTYVTGHFNSAMTVWNGNVKEILVDTTAMSGVNDIGTFIIQDLCPSHDELTGPGMIGSAPYYSWKNIVGYLYDNLGDTNPNSEGGIPVNNAWIKCSVADTTGINSLRMEKIDGFTDHNGFYFLTAFHLDPANDDNGLYLSAFQVSGIAAPIINANILDFYGATNYAFTNYANIDAWVNATKIKAFDSPIYSGNVTNIIDKTCSTTGYSWIPLPAPPFPEPLVNFTESATYEVVMNTDLATARANQAVRVYGNVGIGNVSVVCDGGNVVKSNSVGFFEIYVWGKMYGSYSVLTTAPNTWLGGTSKYHAVYTPTAGATGTIIFNVNGESIATIAAYSYSYGATLPSSDINSGTNAITIETSNVKARKRGGKYIVGVRYYDYANRSSDVINTDKGIVYIPFITEDLNKYLSNYAVPGTYQYGKATISVTLGASCPPWAYYYQILISNNMNQLSYLQWKVNDVKYILRVKQTGLPEISTSKVDSSATHLRLSLENINTYYNRNNDSQLGYSYNVGDKIRLITNQLGTYYNGLYEYEIVSWESPNSVLVKYVGVDIEVGSFVEIFTQATNLTDKIFYEVGETYPCTAPGTSGNQHGTTSISLSGGDTYWRKRKIPVFSDFFNITTNYNVIVEDAGISDFYPSKDSDIGRIGIEDPLFKRIYRPSTVRVSNNYVLGSNINGLSENENVDDIELGASYGDIMKMVHVGDSLVAIHKNKCVTMYIGKVLAKTVDSGIMVTTSEFIADHRPLVGDFGTQDPESVRASGNSIFGWDSYKGIVWKYDNNGIDIISAKKMSSYFDAIADSTIWECPAIYDDLYNEYILTIAKSKTVVVLDANNTIIGTAITFADSADFDNLALGDLILVEYPYLGQTKKVYGYVDFLGVTITGTLLENVGTITADIKISFKNSAETIAYSAVSRSWTSKYSFTPENYCSTKKEMVSFKDGTLWIHDKNTAYNNFFGVQHKSLLTIIVNGVKEGYGLAVKIWLAATMRAFQVNKLFNWDFTIVKNKTQLSRILKAIFKKREQYWHSEFKRDLNTPSVSNPIINGNPLRSQTLEITMENDATIEINLDQIEIMAINSQKNTQN